MVKNAKDYNDKSSAIFADAERIRKLLSNFMVKHNPAYQDPSYSAVPTPIPVEAGGPVQHPNTITLNTDRAKLNAERPKPVARPSSRRSTPKSLTAAKVD